MTKAGAVVQQAFVWFSRICLWIVLTVLVAGLTQAAYFAAGFQSLLGCRFTGDVLFYFVCSDGITNYLFNVPLLFIYAAASTILGVPPSPGLALLFYMINAVVVLALFRLLHLSFRLVKRSRHANKRGRRAGILE